MAKLKLKAALDKKKISKRAFAKLLEVDRGSLSRFYKGNCNPTLETLNKFAKALGVKVKDLIKE